MLTDWEVDFRKEEDIEQEAALYRSLAHPHPITGRVNIPEYLAKSFIPNYSAKGRVKLNITKDTMEGSPPASVDLPSQKNAARQGVVLNVQQSVWDAARYGDSYCERILAHEIGHIVMHDGSARPYSDGQSGIRRNISRWRSAEWQAQMWEGYFLLPASILEKESDPTVLVEWYGYDLEMTDRRVTEYKKSKNLCNSEILSSFCQNCGGFTYLTNGNWSSCRTCGK